jgi:ubiquinone/menaquinone biosynthesis C-methylase UbiE
MAKIYHDTSDSDLKKHADISSAVIRKIKDACEGSSRILDVGCGRGLLADSLQRSGVDVFGCDVGSRCPGSLRGRYSVARAESLPFSDDYFDVVICSHVLEHIPDIFRALSELRRVASKKVIIVLPIERPYIRGFNLHVWFFPYRYSVLQIVRYGIKGSDAFRLIKIKNEWFYLEHFGG